jgi:molybdopterin-guanine dinucleotide biosynthesis protein A
MTVTKRQMDGNLRVGGIVLCGGKSSRMGLAKAWLPIAGEPMLARIVRLLSEVPRLSGPLVVVAAPSQDLPKLPSHVTVERDEVEDRGPLQGLAAGLDALSGQADAAFVSSCDVPFLQPAFVDRMIELLGDDCVCVPRIDGRIHPLAGVYRVSVLYTVRTMLDANRLRTTELFDSLPARFVGAEDLVGVDPSLASLRNLNTPEEFELARRDLGEGFV